MSDITLSICIATLNRASYIGETLDSICLQLEPGVEVVVLDGGSTDGTPKIVRAYESRYPSLRYLRQKRNGGVDKDFDAAVGLARGEYCWLMSDDDLLSSGAISAVLSRIREGSTSLVIVNADVWNRDYSRQLEARRLLISEDQVYGPNDLEKLFSDTGSYLTFIGCVVIRRGIWMSRDRESYFGSLFIHVGVIFQGRFPENVVVIAEPLIRIRYGNAMWKARDFEVWAVRWPKLIWSFDDFAFAEKAKLAPPPSPKLLIRFALMRAKGSYTLSEYRRWIAPCRDPLWFKSVAILVALIPGVILNSMALLVFYRSWERGARSLEVIDLRQSRYFVGRWLRTFTA